jgi:hypothetical protein
MRLFSILLIAARVAAAAQSYTAVLIPGSSVESVRTGSTIGFANLIGLNNRGQVLGDGCNIPCNGLNRFPALWSNGVMTPLPIPSGFVYIAVLQYYAINDSGTVVGTLQVAGSNTGHVVEWENGIPVILPDAPIARACSGPGCTCSTNGSSASYSLNAAGHIVGSTTYPSYTPGGPACSGFWVYDGANFRILPTPIPAICTSPPLPPGYAPGIGVGFPAMNDADQVVQTVNNFFCGPPYIVPGFPAEDPALILPNGSYSFLPLGSLAAAAAVQINDLGDVQGFIDDGGVDHVVIWDRNGVHDLGPSGYASLNNVGQVVYRNTNSGAFELWQNGVSNPIQLPAGLFNGGQTPASLNDAGQFTAGDGVNNYLLTPSGPCGQDVSSQVQVTRGGFRLNHATGHFTQTLTVTSTSASSIIGPISIALDNIPANATLFGIAGATLCDTPQGSPYMNLPIASLDPGVPAAATVEFIDTANTGITYNIRVLAGPGGR